MAKVLLAAALLWFGSGNMVDMGSASIVINPSPPSRGDTVTLTCDGIPPGTVLKLDIDPPGSGPDEVVVGKDGKASFVVPDNAEGIIVSDPESGATAATTVNP